MKVYLMTDMEGVAGILNFEDWCTPGSRYYELGKEFVTGEASAAVDGFFAAGATEVVVADGHGAGAIAPHLLDPRAELMRGWPEGFPFGLDPSYAAIGWVGQHAKAGSERAHLAHTQSFRYLDLSVDDVSIGEFGQMVLCASELGVPSVLAAGDQAFTLEAQALVPGIEAVSVKRGTTPGTGDDLNHEQYSRRNLSAVHRSPASARERIRKAAEQALRRIRRERFGLVEMRPPFTRVARFRPEGEGPVTTARESHPSSVVAQMNLPFSPRSEG